MTKKTGFILLGWMLFRLTALAQLPNGSVAPDFNVQDINGQLRHLYQTLDSGKIVVLEISATWCAPCWAYHQSHALQDFYAAHGPSGDNQARVFWVEGDPNTNINCIYGQAGCNNQSPGNYTTGVQYPIINSATIANQFQITYYPSIFIICPNKKCYEVDALSADLLWEKAQVCPIAYGTNNAGIFELDPGYYLPEICGNVHFTPAFSLTNLGALPLVNATIQLKWNGDTVQSINWNGNLNTYEAALVQFDSLTVHEEGTLNTVITNINNNTPDDDFSDNYNNSHYIGSQHFNDSKMVLKIRTDGYGQETYWEVRDESGNVVEHGGNSLVGPNGGGAFPLGVNAGPGAYANNTLIKDTLNLPGPGCYSIHFADAYGDGMCCQYGNGYYKLYNIDNPVTPLITSGQFEAYDRHAFEAGGVASATASPDQLLALELFPNPASDRIQLEFNLLQSSELQFRVLDLSGKTLRSTQIVSFAAGDQSYELPVRDLPNGLFFLQSEQVANGQRRIRMLKFSVLH